jgi:hypothetical protein
VDGAQQSPVIKILIVINVNAVILFLDGEKSQFLRYADLVTIRNSECTAIYGNSILESVVCAESVTTPVKNACNVSC